MNSLHYTALWLLVLAIFGGCASSEVTAHKPYEGKLERPDRIIVYDFAATPADLPAQVAIAGVDASPSAAQTPDQLVIGRKLGYEIASTLVTEIGTMGLTARRAADTSPPQPGDALIVGYFTTVDPGSSLDRVVIGFGAGGAELKTVVHGYLKTTEGLRPLGSGEVRAGSGRMPGGAVPLVVAVATANPIGLVVGGAAKAYGEVSGSETIEGAAKRTAKEIADKIRLQAEKQGWI